MRATDFEKILKIDGNVTSDSIIKFAFFFKPSFQPNR